MNAVQKLCVLMLAALAVVGSSGCTTPAHTSLAAQPFDAEPFVHSGRFRKEYVIVPGDTIEISVWRVPEISRTVVVRPDGAVSLPTLSEIPAAGKTFGELEQSLTEMLSARLRDPQVTVIATNIRSSMVYVIGDVGQQGAIPLQRVTSAMQAVAVAGGFRRSGAQDKVSVIRLGADGVLRALPVAAPGGAQPDPALALSTFVLEPDDIIFVPESMRSEAVRFLDDFVTRPLGYVTALTNLFLSYRLIQNND